MTKHDGAGRTRTESATEELRRLLDERGVEHVDAEDAHAQHTFWSDGDHEIAATDSGSRLAVYNLSPEQAVEATLGAPCASCEAMADCDECLRADDSHKAVRGLVREVAELRELVAEMFADCVDECDEWRFRDRMRGLGIEVDG